MCIGVSSTRTTWFRGILDLVESFKVQGFLVWKALYFEFRVEASFTCVVL